MISFTISKWVKNDQTDDASLYVQEVGGYIEVGRHLIEFYVPKEYRDFIIMKYPFLREVEYIL